MEEWYGCDETTVSFLSGVEIWVGVHVFFLFVFYFDTLLELMPPESFEASRQCSLKDLKLIEASGNPFLRLVSNSMFVYV